MRPSARGRRWRARCRRTSRTGRGRDRHRPGPRVAVARGSGVDIIVQLMATRLCGRYGRSLGSGPQSQAWVSTRSSSWALTGRDPDPGRVSTAARRRCMRARTAAFGLARRHGAHRWSCCTSRRRVRCPRRLAVDGRSALHPGAGRDRPTSCATQVVRHRRERRTASTPQFVTARPAIPYKELIAVARGDCGWIRDSGRRVDAVRASSLIGSLAGRLVRDASWPITVVP